METTSVTQQAVLGKRPSCGAASMWDVRMESDGVLAVEICQDGSGTYYAGIESQARVNDGGFHHVVINRWGTNIYLFIDGGLDSEVSLAGVANIQNATALTAGRSACTSVDGTGYFTGILDEITLWRGDNSPWGSSRNLPPMGYYNLQNPATSWTNGVRVDSTNGARLAYNYLEADGSANLNGGQGAVRFWFNPDWNGGTGTGAPGYLLELGDVYAAGGGWALTTDPGGTGLSFVSGSNGVLTTYLTAPISGWVSNSWHQVVLSYATNQTVLFIDGGLVTNGPGLWFEPDLATRLADGFTVGSDHYGSGEAGGVLDELTTFNCPLAQSDVIAGYPKPAILTQPVSVTVNNGSTAFFTVVADSATTMTNQWKLNGASLTASDRVTGVTTNYTGTATNVLTVADVSDGDTNVYTVVLSNSTRTLTSANAVLTVNDTAQLGGWLFTTTNWAGQQGQLPLLAANVSAKLAWSTNGVRMDTNVAARLVYRDVETNGSANINCRVGSVVLWFNPDWSSTNAGGSGPGNDGRFIEPGTNGTEWWALCLDSRETNLSFCTETNGSVTTNATAAVSWTNNTWHQVAVTYTTDGGSGVKLYVDGASSSYGTLTPVSKWPRRSGRGQGMAVGSDNATGLLQIRGVLADLETYNYVLSGDEIADDYAAIALGGISYSGWFTNQFTRFQTAHAGINGPPSASMAILVNSTSLASATWIPFDANPSVNLGTGNGTRTVNFYFQALNGMISWLPARITVDTNPPVITITSPGPGTNTVNQPVLQLEGFSPEQLSLISCDVSNAAGLLTNLAVQTMDRFFDTNLGQFTTNYFEALDLGLTNGTNRITLHATDLAGNVTTSNFSYNLDYTGKSNPVIQLY